MALWAESSLDPAISQSIATFIGALTTAVLMAASYYWGPRSRRRKDDDEPKED